MKTLLSAIIFLSFFYGTLLCQHPNIFLKDVYGLEWSQDSKIKSLNSKGGNYTFINGVPIGKKSKNTITKENGKVIEQSIGNGSIKMTTRLSADLKQLKSTQVSVVSTYFFYDKNNLMKYKVGHANINTKNAQYMEGHNLEEMTWNSLGHLIRKEVYNYKTPLINSMRNLEKMQAMDRELRAVWEFIYNDGNELVEIIINHHFTNDESKPEKGTSSIKIQNENCLPIFLEVKTSGRTPMLMSNKRNFSYTF